MNQQGFIMEIVDDRTAKLKMQRHSACAACENVLLQIQQSQKKY